MISGSITSISASSHAWHAVISAALPRRRRKLCPILLTKESRYSAASRFEQGKIDQRPRRRSSRPEPLPTSCRRESSR